MRVEMILSHEGVHLNRIADLTALPDGTFFAHLETAWGPAFLIVGNPPLVPTASETPAEAPAASETPVPAELEPEPGPVAPLASGNAGAKKP